MKNEIKCEEKIAHTTMVRGWYDYHHCKHNAKYKVTDRNGKVHYLCGVHKRSWEIMGIAEKVEQI